MSSGLAYFGTQSSPSLSLSEAGIFPFIRASLIRSNHCMKSFRLSSRLKRIVAEYRSSRMSSRSDGRTPQYFAVVPIRHIVSGSWTKRLEEPGLRTFRVIACEQERDAILGLDPFNMEDAVRHIFIPLIEDDLGIDERRQAVVVCGLQRGLVVRKNLVDIPRFYPILLHLLDCLVVIAKTLPDKFLNVAGKHTE